MRQQRLSKQNDLFNNNKLNLDTYIRENNNGNDVSSSRESNPVDVRILENNEQRNMIKNFSWIGTNLIWVGVHALNLERFLVIILHPEYGIIKTPDHDHQRRTSLSEHWTLYHLIVVILESSQEEKSSIKAYFNYRHKYLQWR